MKDELRFGYRIRQLLDRDASQVDDAVADRLFTAREEALTRQRGVVAELSMAGGGHVATEPAFGYLRLILATMALSIGAAGSYFYWNTFEQATENAEIDSALLADEVPFSAYLDQGFIRWLDHVSQQEDSEQP